MTRSRRSTWAATPPAWRRTPPWSPPVWPSTTRRPAATPVSGTRSASCSPARSAWASVVLGRARLGVGVARRLGARLQLLLVRLLAVRGGRLGVLVVLVLGCGGHGLPYPTRAGGLL